VDKGGADREGQVHVGEEGRGDGLPRDGGGGASSCASSAAGSAALHGDVVLPEELLDKGRVLARLEHDGKETREKAHGVGEAPVRVAWGAARIDEDVEALRKRTSEWTRTHGRGKREGEEGKCEMGGGLYDRVAGGLDHEQRGEGQRAAASARGDGSATCDAMPSIPRAPSINVRTRGRGGELLPNFFSLPRRLPLRKVRNALPPSRTLRLTLRRTRATLRGYMRMTSRTVSGWMAEKMSSTGTAALGRSWSKRASSPGCPGSGSGDERSTVTASPRLDELALPMVGGGKKSATRGELCWWRRTLRRREICAER
jgi:hypothetical protein